VTSTPLEIEPPLPVLGSIISRYRQMMATDPSWVPGTLELDGLVSHDAEGGTVVISVQAASAARCAPGPSSGPGRRAAGRSKERPS